MLQLFVFSIFLRLFHFTLFWIISITNTRPSVVCSVKMSILVYVRAGRMAGVNPKATTLKQSGNEQSSGFIKRSRGQEPGSKSCYKQILKGAGKREVKGNSRQVTVEIRQKIRQEGKRWKARYKTIWQRTKETGR